MPYVLNAQERFEVEEAFKAGPDEGQPGNFVEMYTLLRNIVRRRRRDGSVTNTQELASLKETELWLDVAIGANSNSGAQSHFIRAFTVRQGQLRLDSPFSDAALQEASNQVARNLFENLSSLSSSSPWTIPTLAQVAEFDASAIGEVLFGSLPSDDTAVSVNAGWSGTLGFNLLGSEPPFESWRLLSAGDTQETASLNRLDDFKNVLFAVDAYRHALSSSFNYGLRAFVEVFSPYRTAGFVDSEFFRSLTSQFAVGKHSGEWLPLVRNVASRAPKLSLAVDTIASLGIANALNMLKSTYTGSYVADSTEQSFVADAYAFFSGMSAQTQREMEFESLAFLTTSSIAALARETTGDRYRNALRALSLFVLDLPSYSGRSVSLYDPTTGAGDLSAAWISHRAQMLRFIQEYRYQDLEYTSVLDTTSRWFSIDTIPDDRIYVDEETGIELEINGRATGTPASVIYFGSQDGDYYEGGNGHDRLFGDLGNDELIGGEGDDYLDGGSGNDVLAAGPGYDTAAGGPGNDTYLYYGGDGHLIIDDRSGSNTISVHYTSHNYVLGTDSVVRVAGDVNGWADTRGNHYTMVGTSLTIVLEDGGSITIYDFDNSDFGITLEAAPSYSPPSGSNFTVDPLDVPSPPADPAYGAYHGGHWYSSGSFYDTLATEIVSAVAAEDPGPGQSIYARIHGGFGDTHITGDEGFNWLVDDSTWQSSGPHLGIYHLGLNAGNDRLDGGDGDDWLVTHGGDDEVHGGAGNDVLIDTHAVWDRSPLEASTGDPVLWSAASTAWVDAEGNSSNDRMFGGDGNDYVAAHGGSQFIDGGDGDDEIFAGAGDDTLLGGDGADVLSGDTRVNAQSVFVLDGGDYVFDGDSLTGVHGPHSGGTSTYGNDFLDGGAGNDTLFGGGGDDHIIGGAGDDRIQGDFLGASTYTDLRSGLQAHGADPLGIHGNDLLEGGDGSDTIYGGGGDDYIDGGEGDDYLVGDGVVGAAGADVIYGGNGNDLISGDAGNDYLYGGAGTDTIQGGEGDDVIEGGEGDDYSPSSSAGLFGQGGNDILRGGPGKDRLQGGDGDDILEADEGDDLLFGEAGDDQFVLYRGAGQVQITDVEGVNHIVFGPGVSADDVVISTSSIAVFIDFADEDYASMSHQTFATIGSMRFADGSSLDAHAIKHLFKPGTVSDKAVHLSSGVGFGEIGYRRWNDDLLLTYNGSVSSWANTGNLASRGVLFEEGTGDSYGMSSGTKVLALTNWYRGTPAAYLNQVRTSTGITSSFTTLASNAPATFVGEEVGAFVLGAGSADTLIGGEDGEILDAGDGNDELRGGGGDDLLIGGKGNDVYRYELGGGADVIDDVAGADDVLVFGEGIDPEDLFLTEQADGLLVEIGTPASGNQVLILNWSPSASPVERFVFFDTTEWDQNDIESHITGNRFPRAIASLEEQVAGQGIGFSYTVPGDVFADPDLGDTLTYSASYQGGALPTWLSFDSPTRTFSGTRPLGSQTPLAIQIAASDPEGATATVEFTLRAGWTSGDDFVTGGVGDEKFFGMDGNDVIDGSGGDDYLDGGEGDDVLRGGAGDDFLIGNPGNDRFEGGTGADTYYFTELSGHDRIFDQGGHDRIEFALGSDITLADLTMTRVGDDLRLSIGPDSLTLEQWYVYSMIEEIVFYEDGLPYVYQWTQFGDPLGLGDTTPFAGHQPPLLVAEEGQPFSYQLPLNYFSDVESQETLAFLTGTLPGWLTFNPATRTFSGTPPVTSSGTAVTVTIQADDGVNWPASAPLRFYTRPSLQLIEGGPGPDELVGAAAHDYIISGDGDDDIQGGAGNNIIDAGPGDDFIVSAGGDVIFGRDGNDVIRGTTNHDRTVDGGAGDDRIEFVNAFGTYVGGLGDDFIRARGTIKGGSGDDELYGMASNDSIDGDDGDDFIDGGDGHDTLHGGSGDDILFGDVGIDSVYGGAGDDVIDGGSGDDDLRGGSGDDRYVGFWFAFGGSGNDTISELWSDGYDIVEFQSTVNTLIGSIGTSSVSGAFIMSGPSSSLRIPVSAGESNIEEFVLYTDGLPYRYSGAQMMGLVTSVNTAPTLNAVMSPAPLEIDEPFVYELPANLFTDAESQLTLTYSATRTDGSPLPAWLTFDPVLRAFSGTPTSSDSGVLGVLITVEDAGSLTATTALWLDVESTLIDGTSGNDSLNGTSAGEVISGGDGDDVINAQGGDDILYGDGGDDHLDGQAGGDYLAGGLGDDTYYFDNVGDLAVELEGEGQDKVISSVDVTLGNNVENLTLIGSAINGRGNRLDNHIVGNASNNVLFGLYGDDILDGGGGDDIMYGGRGNDTYFVDSASDVVVESNLGGTDTINSAVSWTLDVYVENLTLLGSSDVNATGNSDNNVLIGNTGNNTLNGSSGNDTMIGGLGNDIYVVDNVDDVVVELLGEGTDSVQSSVSYTLSEHVENLALTGFSSISGTGNSVDNVLDGNNGANVLTGNGGNDVLNGGGGADTLIGGEGNDVLNGGSGNDTMSGGEGNDTYVVAQTGDVVVENEDEGTDLVQSSISYTLGNHVENLTLTGSSGLSGTGNALDNVITGNNGANTLTGNAGNDILDGGLGNDTMIGGEGDDIYFVNASGDVTTENAGQGIDTVNSSVTRTLAANIELLFLTGGSAINGTGNSLANLLRGNTANNTLAGGGGTDILEGGAGNDTLSNASGGNSLLNGGAGADTLTGTGNNDLLIGGANSDSITTGTGADIIAFNKGDGQDTVAVSTTKDNTLSLGGGILYADLLFQKSGNNLILRTGGTDQITFTNYYASSANRSVDRLQMIIEGTTDYDPELEDELHDNYIETFDFDGLVDAFDAARALDPGMTSWALTNALMAEHLGGSDTAALGGDLAYRYGRFGTLGDVSFTPALGVLAAGGFGTSAQALQSLASLQDSSARLA